MLLDSRAHLVPLVKAVEEEEECPSLTFVRFVRSSSLLETNYFSTSKKVVMLH
jgi:hypothetical protein